MKFSYNWLKQLVNFDKTPQELAEDLSLKSVEIESVERFGGDFLEKVAVGEIKEIKPHPNADKLQVVKVEIGAPLGEASGFPKASPRGRILQIVCGAPNIKVGQKVPVALIGCVLPTGEIKKTTIRGIEAEGMLCAEDE